MANEIQTAPSTTLADNDDWEQELNLRELSMKGYDGISLTEWAAGDTDRPQIAAGSVIEIDGAIAKFTNQTAITDEGGIADGWCYIKFVVSGADVTPTLTNTFGTWDTAKQGFYASGARFALFKMYRSGAVTKIYTLKQIVNTQGVYDDIDDGVYVEDDSNIYPGQKIKRRIYTATIALGDTNENITHGISNAKTNNRIINIRAICVSGGSYLNTGEGADTPTTIKSFSISDTIIAIVRGSSISEQTFYVMVEYI